MRQLTETARHNEAAYRRSQEREDLLLGAEDLPELLRALTWGMKRSFSVEALALRLADRHGEIRRFLGLHGIDPEELPDVSVLDAGKVATELESAGRTCLGAYHPYRHGHIFPPAIGIASIAFLPFVHHGVPLGYLVLGSRDPARFHDHLAVDFLDRLGRIAALCLDNALQHERLRLHSLTDVLTSLPNRRYLEERLEQEVARTLREQRALSCLFVDADHFKSINDDYGHAVGDLALRLLADCIRSELRASDVAARYGGEEFTLLLPGTTAEDALAIGERIRHRVADTPLRWEREKAPRIRVSIGLSTLRPPFSPDGPAVLGRRLLKEADQALYRAKARGRNRVVGYWELTDEVPGLARMR